MKRSRSESTDYEDVAPKRGKKKKSKGILDLKNTLTGDFELWVLRAPASMDVNKLHDVTLNDIAPYSAKATKKKSKINLITPDSKGKAKPVAWPVRGEIIISEDVTEDAAPEPVSVSVQAPKVIKLEQRHPRFLPQESLPTSSGGGKKKSKK